MTRTESLSIVGMTCGACARRVQRSLQRVPGVQSVAVSLDDGRAAVTYDPALASVDALRRAVVDAGYSLAEAAA